MAWDPNEKGSWAWFTKEASNHGGVESYINDIEENARAETREEYLQWLPWIITGAIGIGALGKTAYDKVKKKITAQKELKQKSDVAKEVLVNGVKAIENAQTSEIDSEEEE